MHDFRRQKTETWNNILAGGLVTKSCLTLETPWTAVHWAPLSMGFPRQESWSGLPSPPPGDLSDPGIEFASSCVFCTAGGFFTDWANQERLKECFCFFYKLLISSLCIKVLECYFPGSKEHMNGTLSHVGPRKLKEGPGLTPGFP